MAIVLNGTTGIGVGTTPSHPLDIEVSSGDGVARIHAAENNNASEARLRLEVSNDFAESIVETYDSSGIGGSLKYNHGDNAWRFSTTDDTDRMRIDSSGRVLIGTTAVGSSGVDNLILNRSGNGGLTIRNGTNNNGNIYFSDGTSGAAEYAGYFQYQHAQDTLVIGTSGSERMRTLSTGRFLFGRTNEFSMGGDAVDYQFEQLTSDAYTLGIHADNTNQRGIGMFYTTGKTADPFLLTRVGNSLKTIIRGDGDLENANNSYGSISDVSMKENIVDANSQWNDIKNIKVRNYNFKASTGQQTHTQIGVIAQELETVSPKLVRESEDGIKTVSYSILYMKAVKALQEAQARIETLETKVAALEGA